MVLCRTVIDKFLITSLGLFFGILSELCSARNKKYSESGWVAEICVKCQEFKLCLPRVSLGRAPN